MSAFLILVGFICRQCLHSTKSMRMPVRSLTSRGISFVSAYLHSGQRAKVGWLHAEEEEAVRAVRAWSAIRILL
jgi:hypothetical protein